MEEFGATSEKAAKKSVKSSQKAAKKIAAAQRAASAAAAPRAADSKSPAERAARAAEEKVSLERWRIVVAAIGVLLALISLLATIWWSK